MQTANTNTQLHTEHQSWLEEVTLWHNELVFYTNMIVRFGGQNLSPEATDQMEAFKSRFDTLQAGLGEVRANVESHDASEGGDANAQHQQLRDKVSQFRKEFNTLKQEFFVFSDKLDY